MEDLKSVSSAALVDKLAEWSKLEDEAKEEIKKLETEIQSRALEIMERKRIKTVEFIGSLPGNAALIQRAAKVNLLKGRYKALKVLFGEAIDEYIKEETDPQYTPLKKFKDIAGPIFLGDFEKQETVADILTDMGIDPKQTKTVLKKLKGDWQKDRELIKSVYAGDDIDTWLYLLEQALVWSKVRSIFGEEQADDAAEKLRKSVLVEESLKIGVKYQTDEEETA